MSYSKKIFLTITYLLVLVSCSENSKVQFEGTWIEIGSGKLDVVNVTKSGENYITEIKGQKYPSTVVNSLLEVNGPNLLKGLIDESDQLVINGKTFIRETKTPMYKFSGCWIQEEILHGYSNKFKISRNILNGNVDVELKLGSQNQDGSMFWNQNWQKLKFVELNENHLKAKQGGNSNGEYYNTIYIFSIENGLLNLKHQREEMNGSLGSINNFEKNFSKNNKECE